MSRVFVGSIASTQQRTRLVNAVCTLLVVALTYYAGWSMRGAVETCTPKVTHAE